MTTKEFSNTYRNSHQKRFEQTLDFMKDLLQPGDVILDLGPENPFSRIMSEQGYHVENTPAGLDLDLDFTIVTDSRYTVVTSFEVFEHMVSPFPLLKASKARKLIASVPLRLWFSAAYWNENDPFDRHYHEFEARQFDMLLEKAGWSIKKRAKWTSGSSLIGLRPLLRRITPRYYIVYCEKNQEN